MSYCSLLTCCLLPLYLLNIKFTKKSDWNCVNYQFTHIIKPYQCNSWFHLKAMISMYKFSFLSWAGYCVLEIVSISVHRESHQQGVTCRVRFMRIMWQVEESFVPFSFCASFFKSQRSFTAASLSCRLQALITCYFTVWNPQLQLQI